VKSVPVGVIESRILIFRGQRVMLDADLAQLYGVTTKRLNEQVKRNRDRFPGDFMFQLTEGEKAAVVANCDHLRSLRFSPSLPNAFTEHGAVMLAAVLQSPVAVSASIQVVHAFVRLRALLTQHGDLARRLDEVEARYDQQGRFRRHPSADGATGEARPADRVPSRTQGALTLCEFQVPGNRPRQGR
jgi:hypothetical protein